MTDFADLTDAERRYTVGSLIVEANEQGRDLRPLLAEIAAMFVEYGVPAPVSLIDYVRGRPVQFIASASIH
ncbi:MAG: hypothetical protein ACTHLA_04860 [Asticcacaulis sp.]|uniref:hypothetical protein n=1 Tax=Asticcacaulis sp. TaxID=1872648 RepID=UPI003F7C7AE4